MYNYNDITSIFPLGKLSFETIKNGFFILDAILLELSNGQFSESDMVSLSNQYYTTIPHITISLIDSFEQVKEEKKLLSHMLTI